jgi:hypothetical protein
MRSRLSLLCTGLAALAAATILSVPALGQDATPPATAPAEPTPVAEATGCGCCGGSAGGQREMRAGRAAGSEDDATARAMGCSHRGMGARQGAATDEPGPRHGAHGQGQGAGRRAGMPELMASIHFLIDHHQAIRREVETIENGVVSVTRAPEDPDLVPTLQQHVRDMWALLESGGSIRHWDPLFVAIFEHADEIEMTWEDLPDGIRVVETSSNPEVVALIQAHAEKVDEFVARGRSAMHEPTPLPAPR